MENITYNSSFDAVDGSILEHDALIQEIEKLHADKEEIVDFLKSLNENYRANNEDATEHLMYLLPSMIQKMKPTSLNTTENGI